MRARSATIYSKQSPFKKADANCSASSDSSCLSQKKLTSEESLKLFEDFGPIVSGHCFKDTFSGDFNRNLNDSHDNSTEAYSIPSLTSLSHISPKCSQDDIFGDEDAKINKMFKGMVIGMRSVGKHSLVNAMYPHFGTQQEHFCKKQEFDLITGKNETEESVERYRFWLKECKEEESHYRAVMSSYYKNCSIFFLVYDTSNKASFECLRHEIQLIQEMTSNKEVMIILIGNKRAGANCEVSMQEATLFKEEFNVKLFLEVDISSESVDTVRDIINTLL